MLKMNPTQAIELLHTLATIAESDTQPIADPYFDSVVSMARQLKIKLSQPSFIALSKTARKLEMICNCPEEFWEVMEQSIQGFMSDGNRICVQWEEEE